MDRCTHIPIQDSSWHHSEWRVNLSCAVFGPNESEYSPRIIGLYKSFGWTGPTLWQDEDEVSGLLSVLPHLPLSSDHPQPFHFSSAGWGCTLGFNLEGEKLLGVHVGKGLFELQSRVGVNHLASQHCTFPPQRASITFFLSAGAQCKCILPYQQASGSDSSGSHSPASNRGTSGLCGSLGKGR